MKDQHKKIKGYRDLTQKEIDLINEIKEMEAKANGLIDKIKIAGSRGELTYDGRCLALSETNIETGCMYLIKSIAKPERLTK